jgi:hypothetical protein
VVFGINPVSTKLVTPAATVPVGVAPAAISLESSPGKPDVVETIYWYPFSGKGVGAVQETVTPVAVNEEVTKAVGGKHEGTSTTLKVKSINSA